MSLRLCRFGKLDLQIFALRLQSVQLLFEGFTLGMVSQRAPHPLEGYLVFAATALYLIAIALLPAASWSYSLLNATTGSTVVARRAGQ